MNDILERAARCGLETEYRDAFGQLRSVEPEVLARLLNSLAVGGEEPPRMLPRTVVLRGQADRLLHLSVPEGLPLWWEIRSEQKIADGEGVSPVLHLPQGLPHGVFRLHVRVAAPAGPLTNTACLVVCPDRAYQGGETAPQRMWALAVQLYGVRSSGNWGHGDFSDLITLIDLAADLGASGIGLNPLHALFDDRAHEASPYFPNSRLFLNPLYIDVGAVPEFPGLKAAGLADAILRLRDNNIVDYHGVANAKTRGLKLAYKAFRVHGTTARREAFDHFRQQRGSSLARFGCFEVMRRKLVGPWWEWPDEWRRVDDKAIERLRRSAPADVGFIEFEQWIAHEQLDLCRARARARNLPIGLYLDVAVGVRNDSFDAWCDQDAVLSGTAVGAPPDILNTAGQNWGLAGFNPVGLEDRQFDPFCRMLRASMHYAGAIRLDHVLGLKRLYVIPHGMRAIQGAYIRFPFEALLAVAAHASVELRCIVIGEDLGTVPDNFRETLADWGLWSYQVMLFERGWDGTFSAPDNYRENALVTFGTHDVSTFAGWRDHRDLAVKRALGIDPGETSEQRQGAFHALDQALRQRGIEEADFPAVANFLAGTPSRLLVISLEDLLGITDQVNLPGTVDEHPNFRQRLPIALEELRNHEEVTRVAEIMRSAGRSTRG
jgi:4-alpha-glucanotransferase